MIRLRRCTGWSATVLFANPRRQGFPRRGQSNDLIFKSKGLHFCNLNVHHIVPKIDKLRISMAHDKCPDLFGMCETTGA